MANLGGYIRTRRDALGLRQDEVGFRVGKAQSWIARLENGELRNVPAPETLRALACVLQVTPRDLLIAAGYLTDTET